MKILKEIWEVELYKNVGTVEKPIMKWVPEIRYYKKVKSKTDFDLVDVKGLRRNARFLGFDGPSAITAK